MDYRIVYAGAQAVCGALFLTLLYLRHANDRVQRINKLDVLYCLFLITIVLDAIWIFIDGRPEYRIGHIVLEVVYLSAMAVVGYLWFLYSLDFLPAKTMALRKYRFILAIPVIAEIIIVISSVNTGLIFTVDEGGHYIRGSLSIPAVLLHYAYMLLGSYVALHCRKEALLTMDKRRFTTAALFPVPVLVLSGAQMIFPPGLPTMQGGVLVALLLLYGTTQNVMITRDHLTDLPNRFAFEQDLLSRISHFQPRGPQHLYIFAGDLDKFKSINDTYGHPVGDMALQLASKTLRDVFSSYDAVVFRTGGDEFMMTSETERILDIEEIRRNVNERLSAIEMPNQIHLSMSLGMEEYDGTLDFRELIDSADKKLYEAKRLSA